MSNTTTLVAKDIICKLSKVEGLTTNQMLEVINSIRLALMGYQQADQRDGMTRASVMLENHLAVLQILK